MSRNVFQVYTANPSTTVGDNDLFYIGKSPYGVGDDSAIKYSDLLSQVTPTGAALTATNDTNVTLTLGGTPATALLHAASITAGWAGTLSGTRGGTGVDNGTNTATYAGDLNFANSFTTSGNFAVTQTYTGATNVTFPTSGTLATTTDLSGYLPLTGGTLSGPLTLPVLNLPSTTSSSSGVVYQNSSLFLHSFGAGNTFLGKNAGNLTTTGNSNVGIGGSALSSVALGSSNTAVGSGSLQVATSAPANTAVGTLSLFALTTGQANDAFGVSAGESLLTGSNNLFLGRRAGNVYTGSESNNILIKNPGVLGESNIARIGVTGSGNSQITDMYLAGNVHADTGLDVTSNNFKIAGNQISIGNNVTFSGAFAFTATLVGATNVTFPTSGTLATTSQIPTGAALTRTNDTNVTLTLGGAPATALINAASITAGWNGQLSLARGGTNANLTANTYGVVYSDGTGLAISPIPPDLAAGHVFQTVGLTGPIWSTATYPGTATSTGTILRANGTNWVATTSTFADTYSASNILYSNGANTVTGLATANNGVLITSSGGVPSISSTLPSAVQNNITAVNSAANTLSIGGSVKTFPSGAVNIPSATNVGTFTPGFAFGGGTTGITYSFQAGTYSTTVMPNGAIKTECWASVGLSNKGSSTGTATITGFPTATGSNGGIYIFACAQENISVGAGYQLYPEMVASSTTATIRAYVNGAGNTTVNNTHFANNSVVKFYAVYWNN